MNDFARRISAALTGGEAPPTNFVFSPTSLALALAMVREGAAGATAEQIDAVLQVGDRTALSRAVGRLTRADAEAHDAPDSADELAIVNAMFAQDGYRFESKFTRTLETIYQAKLQRVDFADDPQRVRAIINAWVGDATKRRIPALLSPGSLDEDTRLTLVNAIYMKARWRCPFSPVATVDADFTCADGTVRLTPTMHLVAGLPYAAGDSWRCVELPYVSRDLAMLIVVPDLDGSLAAALTVATSTVLMDGVRVALSLPRFDIETTSSVASALGALGMAEAFDLARADFSGITTSEPMCIGEVIHQANLTVDEEGTEAAAATAMAIAGSGPPSDPPIEFRVDHPFVFAVRDRVSGSILFLGHIGDPTRMRGRTLTES